MAPIQASQQQPSLNDDRKVPVVNDSSVPAPGLARPSRSPTPTVPVHDEGWMQSPAVAKRFGIQTGTLNKWRQHGKGPQGWKRVSPTVVVYPVSEVLKFEAQWKESVH
jgi:hypothetical protein